MGIPTTDDQNDSLFRTLIATAVDGIMVIDENGIVEVFNDACERLFGFGRDEVVGRNVKMLMPAPYRDEHDGYVARYRQTGEARIIGIGREVQGRRKDGSVFPMYLSVGQGSLRGRRIFVGIIHDLTERRAAELRQQSLQSELSHVARLGEMGQLSAAIAHELNQPLTAILNYANAAKRLISVADAAAADKALDAISKAADQAVRAGQIIRRLRNFVEKRDSARTIENINAITEDAIALGLLGTRSANIKTTVDLAERSLPILVDRVQIQQVLVNLVRNAAEAMADSPKRELTISTTTNDHEVGVAVGDTGTGIPEELAARLFKPFVTTKPDGLGIGLAISRSIIEAHGGRLHMNPNDGGGTVFRFTLPAAPHTE